MAAADVLDVRENIPPAPKTEVPLDELLNLALGSPEVSQLQFYQLKITDIHQESSQYCHALVYFNNKNIKRQLNFLFKKVFWSYKIKKKTQSYKYLPLTINCYEQILKKETF